MNSRLWESGAQRPELSVAYIDHNTLQTGFENADDHRFIRSAAKKRGLLFSRPGNSICHQVHLERFGIPGKTLIGSDSHTPTGGGIGMLSVRRRLGLDVAVAMGGGAYYITMPKMTRINLHGALSPWVSAKDIILEVLRIMSVKGGVGKIIEYGGDGDQDSFRPRARNYNQHGHGARRNDLCFPLGRSDESFSRRSGQRAGLGRGQG